MRFVLFFSVLFGLLTAISYFVYRRSVSTLSLPPRIRRMLAVVLVTGPVALVGSRALPRGQGSGPGRMLAGAYGGIIELGVIVAAAIMLLAFVAGWIAKLAGRFRAATPEAIAGATVVDTTVLTETFAISADEPAATSEPALEPEGLLVVPRRSVLQGASTVVALAGGFGSAGYGVAYGRHDYALEEVAVRLGRLPKALDGFTIAQLSDIHLGVFVGEREIKSALELIDRIKPDVIALTGDLIDHDASYAPMLGSLVRRLRERAPVIAAVGNHDYYSGIGSVVGTLRRAGAEVLINRSHVIDDGGHRLAILGVDDVWGKRMGAVGPDIQKAVKPITPDLARVLLCHNPAYFPDAAPHVDLQISGHTHGGQFNPGVRPADIVLPYGYVAGRYERDQATLWVNKGFGTAGPPARLGAAPEVTKIVLTT